jgi:DNA-binding GntR family transcriptional regulator
MEDWESVKRDVVQSLDVASFTEDQILQITDALNVVYDAAVDSAASHIEERVKAAFAGAEIDTTIKL